MKYMFCKPYVVSFIVSRIRRSILSVNKEQFYTWYNKKILRLRRRSGAQPAEAYWAWAMEATALERMERRCITTGWCRSAVGNSADEGMARAKDSREKGRENFSSKSFLLNKL